MKVIFLIIPFFLSGVITLAQTLEALVKTAIENNLELKALESEYLAALERAPQVSQFPDLEAGIGAFPLPVETRLGAQIFRIGATQRFPWFGTLDGKRELESAKARALFERIDAKALDLSYQIEQAYFRLYEMEQSQSIIRQNIPLLEALERLALSKVSSGKTTAADALRVQVQIAELKQQLALLETAKTKPVATINRLLNRDLATPVHLTDSLIFASIPFDKSALAAAIEANHPMLRQFELQQEISRKAIALNGLDSKPDFGLGLDYILVDPRNDAEPVNNGRDIVQLRASVKIPLNRKKYDAKEREEELKIAALAYQKADLLSSFLEVIEKAFADHQAARLQMDLYQQQKEITRAAIHILETDYSARGNNFDELLRLEKELIDYDLKILKAVVGSHLVKSSIERFVDVRM